MRPLNWEVKSYFSKRRTSYISFIIPEVNPEKMERWKEGWRRKLRTRGEKLVTPRCSYSCGHEGYKNCVWDRDGRKRICTKWKFYLKGPDESILMDILSIFHFALQKCGWTRKNCFYEDELVDVRARTCMNMYVRVCHAKRNRGKSIQKKKRNIL